MQVRLPPDTRREFDWLAGLSGEGLLVAVGGVLLTLAMWNQPTWPAVLRITATLLSVGLTAALAWGRWPLEEGGDRLTVWVQRIFQYVTSDHERISGGWFDVHRD